MERNYEEEARKSGWTPEEEWKGEPPKQGFKTAEQWIKDGEDILPIVKSKLEKVEAKLEEQTRVNKEFGEFFQNFKEKEKGEKTKLIEELEAVKKQAIDDGDGAAFLKAEQEIAQISKPEAIPIQELTPIQQGWISQNSEWFERDVDMTAYALGMSDVIRGEGYIDQSQAFFDEVDKRVRKQFPTKFENTNRQRASSVEEGGEKEKRDSEAKTFDNLDDDAKAQYERFKNMPGMEKFSKEDYLAQYE